jgi:hypothetical protein
MRLARLSSACALVAALWLFAGCDMVSQMQDGMTRSAAVAESIQRQVGKKPQVGFNFHNGSFTQATVQFADVPSTPLPELEKIVRAAVVSEFKDEPLSLVIAFTYPKGHA